MTARKKSSLDLEELDKEYLFESKAWKTRTFSNNETHSLDLFSISM